MNQQDFLQTIQFEDKELIVICKPAGLAVESKRVSEPDLYTMLLNYLGQKNGSAGRPVYLGMVHRLDQPVEGLLVFAKTKEAASALGRQVQSGGMCKEYLAVARAGTEGPAEDWKQLTDYLVKDGRTNTSRVAPEGTPGAKKAVLFYRCLERKDGYVLCQVRLKTGRHHQIRVQMAADGHPLAGDRKYGGSAADGLGLCAYHLGFTHPGTNRKMDFFIRPEGAAFAPFQEWSEIHIQKI